VLFAITSMPVGGAETLLINLLRRFDREQILPELGCLKEPGPLGGAAAAVAPLHSGLIRGKYDLRVLDQLRKLVARQRIDAVITVGAGDKMFWGRLAAWLEGVPVVLSALHSTGWPDTIGFLNRRLTPVTDGFIAVADCHGRHLTERERFPEAKVHVIPNGVDTYRFRALPDSGLAVRKRLGIPRNAPVCGIVAALRIEKNHLLFLRAAALAKRQAADAHFLIVGDGPERGKLEQAAAELGLTKCVHFMGVRNDIPQLLAALDVFALTSHSEANPVSILEAMACEVPVVSTRVGSVAESIHEGKTGLLADTGDADMLAKHWLTLFNDQSRAKRMGRNARRMIADRWSLDAMVNGYQHLIQQVYDRKCPPVPTPTALHKQTASATV